MSGAMLAMWENVLTIAFTRPTNERCDACNMRACSDNDRAYMIVTAFYEALDLSSWRTTDSIHLRNGPSWWTNFNLERVTPTENPTPAPTVFSKKSKKKKAQKSQKSQKAGQGGGTAMTT